MESKRLTAVEHQAELPLPRVQPAEVSLEVIMKRQTFLGAIKLMVECSGLEFKEAYVPLKIDAGQWSKIMNGGGAHFPTDDRLERAMDICSSNIPLIWLAHRRGFGVHLLETEAERQLRVERGLRIRAETKLEALQEAIAAKFGA